jgi:hypothetical protein
MRRYLPVILLGLGIFLSATKLAAKETAAVPLAAGLRDAIDQACPCTGFPSHGRYMRCVREQLKTTHQRSAVVRDRVRCAGRSTCGRARNPVVCCLRNGHALVAPPQRCAAQGGTVATGVTSLCDAVCPKAAP